MSTPAGGGVGEQRLLIYEQRIWSPYRQDADGNSAFFYGTEGMMTRGRNGIRVFGANNQLIATELPSDDTDAHQRDFLDAVKDRSRRPNADIQIGHLSSTLCHLGNIVARTRRAIAFDPKTEQILGDEQASQLLGRKYREGHWALPT